MRNVLLAAALLAGCNGPTRTEILVEVRSDLLVPEELDRIEISARSPEGRTQPAAAELGRGEVPLPRVLGLVHRTGALGPYALTIRGMHAGELVLERRADVTFEAGRTLVLRVDLVRECVNVTCEAGLTCAVSGCRSIDVMRSELSAWDGRPPPLDAASVDACVPLERCNGVDDDCDGAIDEGFDVENDPANCGGCGVSCARAHTVSSCVAGRCTVSSCEPPWADCDTNAANGCETDTNASSSHCGLCDQRCSAPDRDCCSGVCGRCL